VEKETAEAPKAAQGQIGAALDRQLIHRVSTPKSNRPTIRFAAPNGPDFIQSVTLFGQPQTCGSGPGLCWRLNPPANSGNRGR
jgi:hypothetical protein